MAGSHRKVIVRRNDQTVQAGYLPASALLDAATGNLNLLDVSGRLTALPLDSIRYIAFVRDFNLDDPATPERLTRKTFLARPRTDGLWVRVSFRDGEVLEGLAALDLSLLLDARADAGLYIVPPDFRSNTQRLFVPNAAMARLDVLGVVTTGSRAPVSSTKAARKESSSELRLPFPEVSLK